MRKVSWFRFPRQSVRVLPTTAAVVLLAAVASAQAQAQSQLDPVQLRLDLIEHVEDAFASGDVATLNDLVTLARLVEQNDQWLAKAQSQDLNQLLRPEILEHANLPGNVEDYLRQSIRFAREPDPDGLVGVSAPLIDAGAFGLCFLGQALNDLTCYSDYAYCLQGTTVGGDPNSPAREWQLKAAELQCDLELEYCRNGVAQGWNLCKVISVLLPG